MNKHNSIILASISGLLFALAFPSFNLGFIAWGALVPFFIAISNTEKIKDSVKVGFAMGFTFNLITLYWLYIANVLDPAGNKFLDVIYRILFMLGVTLVLSYLSCYFILFVLLTNWIFKLQDKESDNKIVSVISIILFLIFIPSVWISIEFIRTFFPLGFPWVLTGYSQSKYIPLIQIASITGVHGLSFLIVLVNVIIFLIVKYLKRVPLFPISTNRLGHSIRVIIAPLSVLIIILLLYFWGKSEISRNEKLMNSSDITKVAMIQGNIGQAVKWDEAFKDSTFSLYIKMSKSAVQKDKDVKLIIWPETAAPCYLSHNPKYIQLISQMTRELKIPLLTGAPDYEWTNIEKREYKTYNSAFMISEEGEIVNKYYKIFLVPFGEALPGSEYITILNKLNFGEGDFSPGKEYTVFKSDAGKFSVLICFESIFPQISRKFGMLGAEFLVNITNDAWFNRTSAPHQHYSAAVFRAVENRMSIARCANSGVTMIIDTIGRIWNPTQLYTRTFLVGEIAKPNINTFYAKYGDIIGWASLTITILGAIAMGIYKFFRVSKFNKLKVSVDG